MTHRRRFECRAGSIRLFFLFAGLGLGLLGLSFASGCGSNNQPATVQTPGTSSGSGGQRSGSQPSGASSGQSGGGADASVSQGGSGAPVASSGGSSGTGSGPPTDDGGIGDGGNNDGGNSDGGSPPQPDCTPSNWKDPGTVANPKVEAVAADAGSKGLFGASLWDNIGDFGYAEDEYFITGTSPAYTSRIFGHRPKDASKFTGTVIMEWYNVT